MKLLELVNNLSKTNAKVRKMTNVVHCNQAVDPVPLWKDANAIRERKRIRDIVIR